MALTPGIDVGGKVGKVESIGGNSETVCFNVISTVADATLGTWKCSGGLK